MVSPGVTLGIGDTSTLQQMAGTQSVNVPVTLSSAAAGTSVHYTITPGSATYSQKANGGGEFGGKLSGTFTFQGMATNHPIAVPVWPDAIVDADHSFTVTLSGVSNGGSR